MAGTEPGRPSKKIKQKPWLTKPAHRMQRLPTQLRHAISGQNVLRAFASDVHIGVHGTGLADIIDQSLDKGYRRKPEGNAQLRTTRKEALDLYRSIWRHSRLFVWQDEAGQPWRDVLRTSARKEFEAARDEKDPEIIGRLLVAGNDAVQQAAEKFMAKRDRIIQEDSRQFPPPG